MVKEFGSNKEIDMKELIIMTKSTGKVFLFGQVVIIIMEISLMIIDTDMVVCIGVMVGGIKGVGNMVFKMGMDKFMNQDKNL
jgi:hypothetical protein